MVSATLASSAKSGAIVAQTRARASRTAPFTRSAPSKAALFTKSERSLSQAVAGRIATVQVRWARFDKIHHLISFSNVSKC